MLRRTGSTLTLSFLLMACAGGPGTPSAEDGTRGTKSEAAQAPLPDAVTDMDLTDMTGRRHEIDAILADGKSVVLVFWQTWCTSCLREGPSLVRASNQHRETHRFFGVVTGPDDLVDDAKVKSLARRLGLPYPQVRDRDGDLAKRFEVEGTPTIIVIAPDRSIVYRGHHLDGKAL